MAPNQGVATAPVDGNGRVCIPAPVRRQLGLEYGDLVQIRVEPVEDAQA